MTDQLTIEVTIQLEQQDVARANRDIALDRLTPYKWVVLGISSAVLSAVFAVVMFPQIAKSPDSWMKILIVAIIGLIGWPAILLAAIHLNARKAAKSLLVSTPSLRGPTSWLFSDNAIRVDSPTTSSHIEWGTYMRVRETAMQFLLYPQAHFAHVIPKRCFPTKDQVTRFREMIRRRIPTSTLQSD